MKGITIGLLVAAGVAGLWAAQRATASRPAPATIASAQQGLTATSVPPTTESTSAARSNDPIDPRMVIAPRGGSDPKMVITPKDDIDPKMVINPPPPRSPEDKSGLQPRSNH